MLPLCYKNLYIIRVFNILISGADLCRLPTYLLFCVGGSSFVFTRWILLITITPLSLMMKTNIVVLMMMWLIMTDPPLQPSATTGQASTPRLNASSPLNGCDTKKKEMNRLVNCEPNVTCVIEEARRATFHFCCRLSYPLSLFSTDLVRCCCLLAYYDIKITTYFYTCVYNQCPSWQDSLLRSECIFFYLPFAMAKYFYLLL